MVTTTILAKVEASRLQKAVEGFVSGAYAVTLTPEGSGWLVWDIEPAAAGNS